MGRQSRARAAARAYREERGIVRSKAAPPSVPLRWTRHNERRPGRKMKFSEEVDVRVRGWHAESHPRSRRFFKRQRRPKAKP